MNLNVADRIIKIYFSYLERLYCFPQDIIRIAIQVGLILQREFIICSGQKDLIDNIAINTVNIEISKVFYAHV